MTTFQAGIQTNFGPSFGRAVNVVLNAEGIAADTGYVLIDLDGGGGVGGGLTTWPHSADFIGAVVLNKLRATLETNDTGTFEAMIGVVKENDATDGSVQWFEVLRVESEGREVFNFDYGPNGFNTKVLGGTPQFFISNLATDDDAGWDNDDYLTSPVGSTRPEPGDVVLRVNETADTGTLDVSIALEYVAE